MAQHMGLLLAWLCLFHDVVSMLEDDDVPPPMDSVIVHPEEEDADCVFPFKYGDGVFHDCVKFSAKHYWCSLNETFQGYWKYCAPSDFAKCAFPFWYRRVIYWHCTEDGRCLENNGVH